MYAVDIVENLVTVIVVVVDPTMKVSRYAPARRSGAPEKWQGAYRGHQTYKCFAATLY